MKDFVVCGKKCRNFFECIKADSCLGSDTRVKKSPAVKAKEGKIQKPIPKEALKVYERDGWKCILCHSVKNLQPHHVFYKALERKRDTTRNEAENMVTLCFECHRKLTDGDKELDTKARAYQKRIKNLSKK